jgi:hypothetical protein
VDSIDNQLEAGQDLKVDDTDGWRKISRIGKTVVVIEAAEEDNFKKADKALGY